MPLKTETMATRISTNASDFCLPDLGEGLEEAELVEWSVHVGDRVQENDTLCKMETAKALVDVPSPRSGIIATLHGKPGQAIKVGSPLVTYKEESASAKPDVRPAAPAVPDGNGREERQDAGTVVGNLAVSATGPEGKSLAAPAVRRLARDLNVDLDQVTGTGIGGRITARDVEAAGGGASAPAAPVTEPTAPSRSPLRRPAEVSTIRIPFRGVRKTIADHLRYSVSHAVHYTVMDEVDVSDLDALRRRLSAASNEKISLLPFVAFAVCRVLTMQAGQKFGRLNSTVDDDTQEIVQHRSVHLGIATDTDSGLMVPVIRHADRMGVLELSREIGRVAQAARDRTVTPDKLTGSTFTISNFGSLAGRFGTPIINYPEAGILGIGRAREGVVVHNGMLGVGKLLPLSLSADHRVIDGATAAGALGKIMELLQTPEELMPEPEET
jgi:pyruvate dehydrogenase E2 component (dihydrolipoamide acetyltransferase)